MSAARLEELREIVRSESINYGELAELQGLAHLIDPGDVELLEWAGVPEHPEPIVCAGTGDHDGQGVTSCDECDPNHPGN